MSAARGFIGALSICLTLVLAGIAWPAATPEKAAATKTGTAGCSFQMPDIPQYRQYFSQLENLLLFKDCEKQGSYLFYQQWYADRTDSRRWGSRGLAVLVIILGASLSVLVNWKKTEPHLKVIIPLIGGLIIVAQGVSQTYAFENAWKGFMIARMKLDAAHDAWQHDVIKASLASDANGLAQMEAATDVFARQVTDIVLEETAGFFTAVEAAGKERNAEKPFDKK